MDRIEVKYKVKYKGEESIDLEPNKIYNCIAEIYDEDGDLHDIAVIDDSGEDYLYDPEEFEIVK